MAITDQLAELTPPQFHVHQYSAANDLVADLNAWAVSLWSPMYSDQNPAFQMGDDGVLHANQNGTYTMLVPDTYYIVFNLNGGINILAPLAFQQQYEIVTNTPAA